MTGGVCFESMGDPSLEIAGGGGGEDEPFAMIVDVDGGLNEIP